MNKPEKQDWTRQGHRTIDNEFFLFIFLNTATTEILLLTLCCDFIFIWESVYHQTKPVHNHVSVINRNFIIYHFYANEQNTLILIRMITANQKHRVITNVVTNELIRIGMLCRLRVLLLFHRYLYSASSFCCCCWCWCCSLLSLYKAI